MVGIGARVGGLGDGPVGKPAVGGWCRLVNGGADQRMAEGDPGSNGEQPVGFGRGGSLVGDAKASGCPPQQRRVADRVGSSQQEQAPGRLGQRRDPAQEALFDPARQRPRAGQPEPACQLRRCHPVGQLEQRQRVAVGLGDDPVADPLVQPAGDDRGQQRPRIVVVQPGQVQPGQPGQVTRRCGITRAEYQRDRFGVHPAGDERQDPGRGLVQPLRVIDQVQQRPVGGHLRQQPQHRQSDQEAIRRAARPQAERDAQRLALRAGQHVEPVQHTPAQLMERSVRQLDLRLDALRPGNLEVLSRCGRVTQQRGLADPGLAAHDEHPAVPRPDIRNQPVQGPELLPAAPEHHSAPDSRRRRDRRGPRPRRRSVTVSIRSRWPG